MSCDLRCLIFC